MKKKSIRTKLVEVFVLVSVLIFVVNVYIFYNQNKTVQEIDSVYNSNIYLNELSETLDGTQESLYQYLNTKSSDMLEQYYTNEQDLHSLIEQLNTDTVSDPNKLA